MQADAHPQIMLDKTAFTSAQARFSQYKSNMAPHEVTILAQEVVNRLARRFTPQVESLVQNTKVDHLCDLLIGSDDTAALNHILKLRADGVPVSALYLSYLAGVSQLLGERWEDDSLSFLEMTIAAGRIYAIMRSLRQVFIPLDQTKPHAWRAIFASVPGDTHTIGVTMAADLCRRQGWQIDLCTGLDHDALIETVHAGQQPVIGLSASHEDLIAPLIRLLLGLRVSAPGAFILLSGKILDLHHDIAQEVDVDGVASTIDQALAQMHMVMQSIAPGNRTEIPSGTKPA
ncbi:cobalamin B12-binding domain-containing protein [Roseicitreum antarcticum]|uniref:B12 binding domain-containing protein n=1 Tax=Roseicitreum antarcticum TaxID=564137 RepID=A0A1H2X4P5_9RHOB|nr:hypothetical protein [Roseicitreum antarcticum]SDW87761.1 B12 binding domain-containing protein [Roseicitreum antarcticum]